MRVSTSRYDFSIQDRTGSGNGARLLYVSAAKYGGDWHSMSHTHNCSELFYVTGGVGQFYIEGKTYPVSAHDLVIVNPHVEHTETSLNANPLEYIVLGVEGLELSVKGDRDNRYCIVNCRSVRDVFQNYLQHMVKEIEVKAPGYEMVCQDLMEVLIIHLMRQTNFSATLAPVRRTSTNLCASVRRYIDEHYKENINLDMLAQMSHVSKYYMVHAFTKAYDISPINYMISLRIQDAKQLLKNDDYSLALISRLLGFSSPSYFSQSFKKQMQMSPQEYRRQSRLAAEQLKR